MLPKVFKVGVLANSALSDILLSAIAVILGIALQVAVAYFLKYR